MVITVQQILTEYCKKIGKSKIKVAKDLEIASSSFAGYGAKVNLTLTLANRICDYFSEYNLELDPIYLLQAQAGQITI